MIETIKSVYLFVDRKRRLHSFELFGYDFMIDELLKVYLIEVNINPCLSTTSAFSSRFIPRLIDNVLRIAVDPMFPPPPEFSNKKVAADILPIMKFELVFDQRIDGPEIDKLYTTNHLSNESKRLLNELNAEIDCSYEDMEEGSDEERIK